LWSAGTNEDECRTPIGGGGVLTSCGPSPPNIEIKKKTQLSRHDAIKLFLLFTLQQNPNNEIG